MPAKKQFWDYVSKTSTCWIWKGSTRGGYGRFTEQGKTRSAHVISFELVGGLVPAGMKVCHSCDNPPCVRPDHLFIGTQHDNVMDAVRKGRHKNPVHSGEAHWNAKLRFDDVAFIRQMAPGLSVYERRNLADRFHITDHYLKRILKGKRWKGPDGASILVRPTHIEG